MMRVVTGVIGVTLLLGLLIWGETTGAHVLAAVLTVGMLIEFGRIVFHLPDRNEKTAVLILTGLGLHAWAYFSADIGLQAVSTAFVALFVYYLFSARRYGGSTLLTHVQELAFAFFGFVYLALLPIFLPLLSEFGLHWVILFLVIVWVSDTGAYFVGRRFGRHKLYALVSPKKSIEGAAGGLALSALAAWTYSRYADFGVQPLAIVGLAVAVNLVSQIGDLCESLLKRAFDRKDSGSILPGHGGFLDRFDSVVLALPVMVAGLKFLGL